MIRIKYDRDTNSTIVLTQDLTPISKHTPINIKMKDIITDEIHFDVNLNSNESAQWVGGEFITDVLIYSSNGQLLEEHRWEVSMYGDEIEKILWYYLKGRRSLGLESNGLVIGTHDGRFGHWIYPIKHQLSNGVLIEGGKKQYDLLVENYKKFSNVRLLNHIVTSDGRDVVWYEGGKGYSDTIVDGLINRFVIDEPIHRYDKESVSINEIIGDNDFDWIHLDVEGSDSELILSMNSKPNILIYENMNLNNYQSNELSNWLIKNNYLSISHKGNTLCYKIKK